MEFLDLTKLPTFEQSRTTFSTTLEEIFEYLNKLSFSKNISENGFNTQYRLLNKYSIHSEENYYKLLEQFFYSTIRDEVLVCKKKLDNENTFFSLYIPIINGDAEVKNSSGLIYKRHFTNDDEFFYDVKIGLSKKDMENLFDINKFSDEEYFDVIKLSTTIWRSTKLHMNLGRYMKNNFASRHEESVLYTEYMHMHDSQYYTFHSMFDNKITRLVGGKYSHDLKTSRQNNENIAITE